MAAAATHLSHLGACVPLRSLSGTEASASTSGRSSLHAGLLPSRELLGCHWGSPFTRCRGCDQNRAVQNSLDGQRDPQVDAGASGSEKREMFPISRRAALLGAVSTATFWTGAERTLGAPDSSGDTALDELRQEIRKAVSLAKTPGVLRLVFHDGFTYNPATQTGGPNGSLIFELNRPENEGLKRAIRPLEKVKAILGDKVSWADLIAVAGAEAVAMTGGPVIPVRLGRRDQGAPDPEDQMPPETLDAATLKSFFHSRNYSTQEMVALSGAHTLGGKGFGNPTTFDNAYYKILLEKPWEDGLAMTQMIGLKTDRALPDDPESRKWILAYADDQGRFFRDFASAYEKLVTQGVTWTV